MRSVKKIKKPLDKLKTNAIINIERKKERKEKMKKVYIVRSGEMGNTINMVTTDKAKAENHRDALKYALEMGGARGTAWIEEYKVD